MREEDRVRRQSQDGVHMLRIYFTPGHATDKETGQLSRRLPAGLPSRPASDAHYAQL